LGFATLFDPNVFSHFAHTGVFAGNLIATLTLAMLVLISVALVVATIIVPLRSTVREAGWQLAIGGTVYFALIGVGFMMIEIALLQRMSVFLGHPVYALSVVLFSLILWTGFGSMASESVRLAGAGTLVAWSVASAAYLFALPFWLPALLVDLDGADLLVRAGLCVLVLAPAGFLMGFGFPTGMRLVSATLPECCWCAPARHPAAPLYDPCTQKPSMPRIAVGAAIVQGAQNSMRADVWPLTLPHGLQFEVRSGPTRGPEHEAQSLFGRADSRVRL
jgi:hypothetical protein